MSARRPNTRLDQVRSQFLKVLYRWDETRLDEFRALFLSRASKDNASDPACTSEPPHTKQHDS
ncbi:hypothetical protein SNOG_04449 [Parastagonospora nodorum SN15]|uniref:Uncharacterized protein n=1 Tax=Phaeosphaeria nodorum (strain SN15 / ATCC MYA-4574 / FGSC 10173) TaxID=321614 RepID=Q0UUW5_PHANO|nr:hypothetical protein SNOG_04449 [Parastagonospora nodorum SN15]EAT88209.1 hypothetical protein SNOG_04449 [Parastagonospora nodorum SN15]